MQIFELPNGLKSEPYPYWLLAPLFYNINKHCICQHYPIRITIIIKILEFFSCKSRLKTTYQWITILNKWMNIGHYAESSLILKCFFGKIKLSRTNSCTYMCVFEHEFVQPFSSKSSENCKCHLVLNYWFTIGLADPDSRIAFEFDFVVFVASALHVIPPL